MQYDPEGEIPDEEEAHRLTMDEKREELDRKVKEKEEELARKEKEVEELKKKVEEERLKKEKEAEEERLRMEKEMADKKEKERAKKEKLKNLQQQLGKVMEELDESAVATEEPDETTTAVVPEEAVTTSPRNGKKRKRKDAEKKKARKETPSESSDEEYRKFSSQARIKVPTLEKGMTYGKYKTNVDMWKIAMKGYMDKKDMGLTLLQALPDEDNRGGLKNQAWKKLGSENL